MSTTVRARVTKASVIVISSGVMSEMQAYIHRYARILKKDVMAKTLTSSIFLGFSSTAMIETAEMMRRLKAAEPTMVEGPSSPGSC